MRREQAGSSAASLPAQAGAGTGVAASVDYLDGEFKIRRPGSFVRCAVTAAAIPIERLCYWNVDKQEAYADAAAVIASYSQM